jgi:phage shock protein PspC (stress-responsive transcriptional regulator)
LAWSVRSTRQLRASRPAAPEEFAMSASKPNLFTRDDTFLGVCEAIGEDCGFNPNYLRVALGAVVLWNAELAIGAYLAAGVLVFLSRWLMPSHAAAASPAAGAVAAGPDMVADNDEGALAAAA